MDGLGQFANGLAVDRLCLFGKAKVFIMVQVCSSYELENNAYSLQNQSVNVSEMNYCSEKQTKFSMHKLGGRNVELFDIQHAIHIVNNALERMVTILKNLKLKPSLRVYIL